MGSVPVSDLPALKTNPKYIFFTDFDGTITLQDSNDFMTVGFGAALRKKGNDDVLLGKRDFRDSFQEMMDSISTPYNQCIEMLLKNIQLDPGFKVSITLLLLQIPPSFMFWNVPERITLGSVAGLT